MMKRITITALAGLSLLASPFAKANFTLNDATFDCRGSLNEVVMTDAGPRATGLVSLSVDLPSGDVWESAGVIVIALPDNFDTDTDVSGIKIRRCFGQGEVEATRQPDVLDTQSWALRVRPTEIRLQAGQRRITQPDRVGFVSGASGDPNV